MRGREEERKSFKSRAAREARLKNSEMEE